MDEPVIIACKPMSGVVLIPGAPDRVQAVQHMFRRRLVDGWAAYRIAAELEQMGIRAGDGSPWCVSSINAILRNPVYTGRGIANRYSSAIYNCRDKNTPKPTKVDRRILANRRRPPRTIRPKNDWMEVAHPHLMDYLGDLREQAIDWQKMQIDKQDPSKLHVPASKDRHVDSGYFLKGILKSNDGYCLTGRTTGKPKHRYYAISRGYTNPGMDRVLRTLIAAEPLEKAILEVVKQVLIQAPDLRQQLVAMIQKQRSEATVRGADLVQLEEQRSEIQDQIGFVIDALGSLGRDAAKGKLRQLEAKLGALSAQIQQATAAAQSPQRDAQVLADEIITNLTHLGDQLETLSIPSLRNLLQSLIQRLEINMKTKAVYLAIAVPECMGNAIQCLEDTSAYRFVYQAQNVFLLEIVICQYRRDGGRPCFDCQRRRKAA